LRAISLAAALLGLGAGPPATPAPEPWFEEVAEASGVVFDHVRGMPARFWFPEIMSGGGCWLDAEGDGDLDLFLVQGGPLTPAPAAPPHRLYRNQGDGTFADEEVAAGGFGMGCAVGDYDGDGDDDLYVTRVGPNALYRNEEGVFRDVAAAAGVAHPGWGSSAAFLDVEGDGDLDLFVVNYVRWSPEREIVCSQGSDRDYCQPANYNAPAPDVLYVNEGGVFRDATLASGVARAFGNGLGVTVGDFDGDGRPDLYVANDGDPNQLWINQGGGVFADRALLSGVAVNRQGVAEAGMGVAAVDVENDGDLDLFVTHLRDETNTLYVNQGGWFDDATAQAGLAAPSIGSTGFGLGFADFDHDGELDLYVANGRVSRALAPLADDPYAEPDQLFRGLGGGRFAEVAGAGLAASLVDAGRAAALADYDGDGDVDVLVVNNGGRARLLRNRAARGRWVMFRVTDRHGHVAAGALVGVRVADRWQWRVVQRAASYLASHDPRVHFGLGAAERVDEAGVVWPWGRRESFGGFAAGAVHELRETTRAASGVENVVE
jgi:hypothetical protein